MVWNLSVSYNKHELITWIMREALLSVCTPLERLLVCIWGEKMGRHQWARRGWLLCNGWGRENLALVRGVLLPSAHLLLDQRDKAELRSY